MADETNAKLQDMLSPALPLTSKSVRPVQHRGRIDHATPCLPKAGQPSSFRSSSVPFYERQLEGYQALSACVASASGARCTSGTRCASRTSRASRTRRTTSATATRGTRGTSRATTTSGATRAAVVAIVAARRSSADRQHTDQYQTPMIKTDTCHRGVIYTDRAQCKNFLSGWA